MVVMKIEQFNPASDLVEVVELAVLFRDELDLNDIEGWSLFLRNLLKQKTYVLKDNKGRIIGFVNFGRNTRNFTHIDYIRAIVIAPDSQGKGLGKLLIKFALSHTSRPTWIMIKDHNRRMYNLLLKLGFRPFIKQGNSIGLIV